MTDFTIETSIGGKVFTCNKFRVTSGAYGSVGSCEIMTSRTMLRNQSVDVVALSIASPVGLEVDVSVTVDQGPKTMIFSGEYVSGEFDYDTDSVTLRARDWAGVLVDQKRPLQMNTGDDDAPDETFGGAISTQNQTITQLVNAICKKFGLTPKVNIPAAQNQDVGTILGSTDTVMTPIPQTLWGLLNLLARDTGNEVYVDPNKNLVFGPPGQGAPPLSFVYNVPAPPSGQIPIGRLRITHNPRRNLAFKVQVFSYNPADGSLTQGETDIIPASATGTLPADLPLYSFHVDGLTQAQAQARSAAIADDIAKRELVVNFDADFVQGVIPMNQMSIGGDIEPEFAGHTYYVNSYTHTFEMPAGEGHGREGILTEILALDLQLEGQGSKLTAKAPTK